MINTTDFAKRLQKVIDYYGESGSSFAEKIGVQRSSISHILSGRNKPSLEFVLKVLASFPEVELYWLMNGKGIFPNTDQKSENIESPKPETNLFTESSVSEKIEKSIKIDDKGKQIDRIIIFYTDGSFSNFEN